MSCNASCSHASRPTLDDVRHTPLYLFLPRDGRFSSFCTLCTIVLIPIQSHRNGFSVLSYVGQSRSRLRGNHHCGRYVHASIVTISLFCPHTFIKPHSTAECLPCSLRGAHPRKVLFGQESWEAEHQQVTPKARASAPVPGHACHHSGRTVKDDGQM